MEYQKITNLLGTTLDEVPRCITKKWVEVHDQPRSADDRYKPSKQIRFKTSVLRSNLCDYSDAYIVVKWRITVTDPNNANYDKKLTFKNNAPFTSCISKINNTLIDNAEDLDIVIPMYNLLEYSKNYRKTTEGLWNYYRDEPNSSIGGRNDNVNYSIKDSKSFDYKTSITGKLEGIDRTKDVEIVVPLNYLSNFWRTLDIPLINCEINLILTWSENCVLTNKATRDAVPAQGGSPAVAAVNNLTNAIFKITDTKLYVPVATLWTKDDSTFLEQLKSGFKRTIKWNKYRSEMTNQTKTNHLNHLIDPAFTKVNRLFVLLFENEEDRTSFSKYYVPKDEIKDFNVLIDGKSFFDVPVENKEEAYEKTMSISKKDDYTTGDLLDYEHFSKYYKLIAIDLSKQIELENLI